MNTIFLSVIVVLVLAILVIFLIVRNRKDEKEFENRLLNEDNKFEDHDTDGGEKESI